MNTLSTFARVYFNKSNNIFYWILPLLISLSPSLLGAQLPLDKQTFVDSLQTEIKTNTNDTSRVQLLIYLGEYYSKYNLDSSAKYSSIAASQAKKIRNYSDKNSITAKKLLVQQAHATNNIAYAKYKLGHIDEALELFIQNSKLKIEIGDKESLAKGYNNIAVIYQSQGKVPEALDYYYKSLYTKEKIGNKNGALYTLHNIGAIYEEQGNYQKANIIFKECVNGFSQTKDTTKLLIALSSYAGSFGRLANYHALTSNTDSALFFQDSSIHFYDKALKIVSVRNETEGLAIALNNLASSKTKYADLLNQNGKNREADSLKEETIPMFKESLKLFSSLGYKRGLQASYSNLASLYNQKNKLTLALTYGKEAFNLSLEIENPSEIANNAKILSSIYFKIYNSHHLNKDIIKAYEYLSLYDKYRDSLITDLNQKELFKKKFEYDYILRSEKDSMEYNQRIDAKEQIIKTKSTIQKNQQNQIWILLASLGAIVLIAALIIWRYQIIQKQKKIIEDQKEKLETLNKSLHTANKEKEQLLMEVHHRVKNNLQVISSLISLQLDQIEDDQVKSSLLKTQDRISSISLIHEKLYTSEDYSKINLAEYLFDLCESFTTLYGLREKSISFEFSLSLVFIDLKRSSPIGIIVNELITNAVKYAFSEKLSGLIKVNLREDNDSIYIEIHDNGIGINSKVIKNKNTVGIKLANGLAKQMKGNLNVESNHGTRYTLTIPKHPVTI